MPDSELTEQMESRAAFKIKNNNKGQSSGVQEKKVVSASEFPYIVSQAKIPAHLSGNKFSVLRCRCRWATCTWRRVRSSTDSSCSSRAISLTCKNSGYYEKPLLYWLCTCAQIGPDEHDRAGGADRREERPRGHRPPHHKNDQAREHGVAAQRRWTPQGQLNMGFLLKLIESKN